MDRLDRNKDENYWHHQWHLLLSQHPELFRKNRWWNRAWHKAMKILGWRS